VNGKVNAVLGLDALNLVKAELVVPVTALDVAHDLRLKVELQDAALGALEPVELVDTWRRGG
jgi:hypothetical protein